MSTEPTTNPASANGATSQTQATTAPSMPVLPAATLAPAIDPVRVGDVMFRSGLFPDLRSAAQAVVKILAGRELGIGPFAALSDIHIIEGKATVGARILAGLVRSSRHYDYKVVEWTNERVAIDFYRDGEKLEPTITFDQQDAERAGLTNPTRNGRPSNHTRYPRHMKFARAMSTGVGLHCPDLTAGVPVYTPGELDADPRPEGQDGACIEGEQSATDQARRSLSAPVADGEDVASAVRSVPELVDIAGRWGYRSETVVALGRFYFKAPNLLRLTAEQRAALVERLKLARIRGITDPVLGELASKGLEQNDRDNAIAAADKWLAGDRGSRSAPQRA